MEWQDEAEVLSGGKRGWKVKRGEKEFACPDTITLKQWGSEGLISIDDYVFNPTLNQWLYAKDVAELQGLFMKIEKTKKAGRLNRLGLLFGIPGILVVSFAPELGGLLLLIGIGLTIGHYVQKP